MTLRDLTEKQREKLIARCKKDWKYWQVRINREFMMHPRTEGDKFELGYNCGVKAVLEILMPK